MSLRCVFQTRNAFLCKVNVHFMLTGGLKAIVNKSFLKSFYTTFMRNLKNYQNINCFLFFVKTFLKWFFNKCP